MNVISYSWMFLYFFCREFNHCRAVGNGTGYAGAQLLNIEGSPEVLDMIDDMGLDVWTFNGTFYDILIPKNSLSSIKNTLNTKAIPFMVKIDDVHRAISKQNEVVEDRRRSHGIPITNRFLRLNDIYRYLDYLAYTYPEIIRIGVITYTAERRPIKYIHISSKNLNAKAVFIDGGIHGREWISPSSVLYIIRELVENRQRLPWELLIIDFYIVPVLNPDGYEYSHTTNRMWRKNRSGRGRCVGTDLNRNFEYMFGGVRSSGDQCSDLYRGGGPNSELETEGLMAFLLRLRGRLNAYITFHSYGQYILIPYGYERNKFAPDFNDMKRVGDAAAYGIRNSGGEIYRVGNSANILYPAAGASEDWVKARVGAKYCYCIELRDRGSYGFLLPAGYIVSAGVDAFEAVKVIARAAYYG